MSRLVGVLQTITEIERLIGTAQFYVWNTQFLATFPPAGGPTDPGDLRELRERDRPRVQLLEDCISAPSVSGSDYINFLNLPVFGGQMQVAELFVQ